MRAWLLERRVHVLILAVSVATVAVIGGALALYPFEGAQPPDREVATVVDTDRPMPIDPAAPSSAAPIPSSAPPPPSLSPTSPAPLPEEAPVAPVTDAPVEPPAESEPAEPKAPDQPEDCDQQEGLLALVFGPQCP